MSGFYRKSVNNSDKKLSGESNKKLPNGYLETIQKGISAVRTFRSGFSYGDGSREEQIARLKKEINTLRQVLRNYIMQVDSLNRINEALTNENAEMKNQVNQANNQIYSLSSERNALKDKVNIAAQLDATGFWVSPKNKRGKEASKAKDCKKLAFGFTIVKNVTAQNGERIIYARILKPDNSVMGKKGSFTYEDTPVEYTEKKFVEYNGEEMKVTMYSDIDEFLEAGTYKVLVFCDSQMIGQTTFTLK